MRKVFPLALALTVAAMLWLTGSAAQAGNWSVLTRWLAPGPTYGCNPHAGLQDCMMPWHPIRSSMHYNVLPPGMLRPPPLYRPTPSLAPPTPDFTAAGVRAAGQRNRGIPCRNPYAGCTMGCSRYGVYDWLHFWRGPQQGCCEQYPDGLH